jgi:Tfp pilus assembly protein PilX
MTGTDTCSVDALNDGSAKMKTQNKLCPGSKNGVALIIVLGLLAVLTLIAVAFAIAMRVERLAARNYVNNIRAEQLVQAGIVRAMETIDMTMSTNCYPDWKKLGFSPVSDALPSTNGSTTLPIDPPIIGIEATNAIPEALLPDVNVAAPLCTWTNIVAWTNEFGVTSGNVAYVAINCSGLLDANYVGGASATGSGTNVNQIDLTQLPDLGKSAMYASYFTNNRAADMRYETVTELSALNKLNDPKHTQAFPTGTNATDFFVYSYDPGRDLMWNNRANLGTRGIVLYPKFAVNSITNTPEWIASYNMVSNSGAAVNPEAYHFIPGTDTLPINNNVSQEFKDYYRDLTNCLNGHGHFPTTTPLAYSAVGKYHDIAINMINYLDPDRIPQLAETSSKAYAFQCSEAYEDTPLISEVAYMQEASSNWMFAVKLWYMFYPNDVKAGEFRLRINVYHSSVSVSGQPCTDQNDYQNNFPVPYQMLITNIGAMSCHTPSDPQQFQTHYITNLPGPTNFFMAQVLKVDGARTYIIDQAMSRTTATCFNAAWDYTCNDPRSNGKIEYWTTAAAKGGVDHAIGATTLGQMNTNSTPWKRQSQGLPCFHRNGPMETVGEIGHIGTGNLDDEGAGPDDRYWQTINILSWNWGGFLLDRMTVRSTNSWDEANNPQELNPAHGLVAINSRQKDVLYSLFHNMVIGTTNAPQKLNASVVNGPVQDLVLNGLLAHVSQPNDEYWSFQSLFDPSTTDWEGGTMAKKFKALATTDAPDGSGNISEIKRQDPLRKIENYITFRQNIFEIIMAARVVGADGGVLAEKRAMATIYRDSYTGKSFMRSFKWLAD